MSARGLVICRLGAVMLTVAGVVGYAGYIRWTMADVRTVQRQLVDAVAAAYLLDAAEARRRGALVRVTAGAARTSPTDRLIDDHCKGWSIPAHIEECKRKAFDDWMARARPASRAHGPHAGGG